MMNVLGMIRCMIASASGSATFVPVQRTIEQRRRQQTLRSTYNRLREVSRTGGKVSGSGQRECRVTADDPAGNLAATRIFTES
jgi:hypothetical protein